MKCVNIGKVYCGEVAKKMSRFASQNVALS